MTPDNKHFLKCLIAVNAVIFVLSIIIFIGIIDAQHTFTDEEKRLQKIQFDTTISKLKVSTEKFDKTIDKFSNTVDLFDGIVDNFENDK